MTTGSGGLLKMDTRGRVRVSVERRQAILDEFDRSGVSGAQFARVMGLRYPTFAGWVSQRRKSKPGAAGRQAPLRLVEAVIDPGRNGSNQGLLVHLPGGVRLEMTSPAQVPLVTALIQALQPPAARC